MKKLQVVIVMGSDSDWLVVSETEKVLKEFKVACEAKVLSAHRTPNATTNYARQLEARGVKVVIAAAGGAAALAGVIAAHTPLPVIGIPMATADLNGLDSLLSTVQMPAGVPVASVGIGKAGAKNAAFLAMKILALNDKGLHRQLAHYKNDQAKKISRIKLSS